MSYAKTYNYLFKYIIVGDSGVGKSSILLRYTDKRFNPEHDITIGVEFGVRIIDIMHNKIKIQIWDTAGQEAFRSITRSYYHDSTGAILVYDITDRASFNHLKSWCDEILQMTKKTNMMLIGNKCDLDHKRQVLYTEGKKFAESNGMIFIETSAKRGFTVEEAFEELSTSILEKINLCEIDVTDKSNGIKIGNLMNLTSVKNQCDDNIDEGIDCCNLM